MTIFCRSGEAFYVLPYPVGKAYICTEGFNDAPSHYGVFRYAVDFRMPMGEIVTAARDGEVDFADGHYFDNDQTPGHENVVIVSHADGTYGRYAHLTHNAILVKMGRIVKRGDPLGKSGCSGTNSPHLHFDVTTGCSKRDCQTIPFCFANTKPHPYGLESGQMYLAEPY